MKLIFAWLAPDMSRIERLSDDCSVTQNCSNPLL
jgi:hypothetical protein